MAKIATSTSKTATKAVSKAVPAKATRTTSSKTTATKSGFITIAHDEIAKLAYRYYVERGYQHGFDTQDWKKAEAELRSKAASRLN